MITEEIIKSIKNKIYKPIYFLAGEESYFIDEISDYIQNNILNDEEKAFNQIVLYGKDIDVTTIITTARRYPMLANYQVIIIKEAQTVRDIENLEIYAQSPLKSTILVINYKYKNLDKRKKLYKILSEKDYYFEFKKLYDNQLPDWIISYVNSKNLSIDIEAANLIAEFLGNDLSKIVNEIDKLIIATQNSISKINSSVVEKYIGISKEYSPFELQKALTEKDKSKCFRIADHYAKDEKDYYPPLILSNLFSFFSKVLLYHYIPPDKRKIQKEVASLLNVNLYFVKDYEKAARMFNAEKLKRIISYIRDYDMKLKGYNNITIAYGDALKELISLILM